MATLIPGVLYAVMHSSGGAMLSSAVNGYVGGTFVSAGAASAVPFVAAAAAITLTAAGAYLYFHGIPAPIAESISAAGLGTTSAKGVAISFADVAAVLAILAAAGYVLYRYSDTFRGAVDGVAEKASVIWDRFRAKASNRIKKSRNA
jgi:hypothetical protein